MSVGATSDGEGARLTLQVVPRASRSEVVGFHGDAIRIRLQAPPVDGKANRALLEFLAEALGVPVRALTLVSGEANRRKVVRVPGVSPAEAVRKLGL